MLNSDAEPTAASTAPGWTIFNLSLRLKDLLGPVTRVKKKKEEIFNRVSWSESCPVRARI